MLLYLVKPEIFPQFYTPLAVTAHVTPGAVEKSLTLTANEERSLSWNKAKAKRLASEELTAKIDSNYEAALNATRILLAEALAKHTLALADCKINLTVYKEADEFYLKISLSKITFKISSEGEQAEIFKLAGVMQVTYKHAPAKLLPHAMNTSNETLRDLFIANNAEFYAKKLEEESIQAEKKSQRQNFANEKDRLANALKKPEFEKVVKEKAQLILDYIKDSTIDLDNPKLPLSLLIKILKQTTQGINHPEDTVNFKRYVRLMDKLSDSHANSKTLLSSPLANLMLQFSLQLIKFSKKLQQFAANSMGFPSLWLTVASIPLEITGQQLRKSINTPKNVLGNQMAEVGFWKFGKKPSNRATKKPAPGTAAKKTKGP